MLTEKEIEEARDFHDKCRDSDAFRKEHPRIPFIQNYGESVLSGDNFEGRVAEKREKDFTDAIDSIFQGKKGRRKKKK